MTRGAILHVGVGAALAFLAFGMVEGRGLDLTAALSGVQPETEILLHLRLPRVALAMLVGAALGMAGSAMQVMLRNPLASPDVIGIGAGAAAGMAAATVFAGVAAGPAGALVGGGVTAAALAALTPKGGTAPLSLVLIGVALGLMLVTVTDVILGLAPGLQAAEVVRMLTGSFAAAEWRSVGAMAGVTALGGAVLASLAFAVDRMDMGDDMARSLGLAPSRVRVAVLAVATVLVSAAVAVAGLLAFVAFLAGPLARLLTARPGTHLGLAALTGALVALAAEAAAGVPVGGVRLPAGVFTAVIGGPAMIALLLRRAAA